MFKPEITPLLILHQLRDTTFGDSVPHSFYADDITLAGIQLKRSHRVISENSQLLDAREGPVMTWISPAAPALPATSQLR